MKIEQRIEKLLEAAFQPQALQVIDNSHLHAGHAGARAEGETHFKVIITAQTLQQLSKVKAHQAVYKALDTLMGSPIHALEIEIL